MLFGMSLYASPYTAPHTIPHASLDAITPTITTDNNNDNIIDHVCDIDVATLAHYIEGAAGDKNLSCMICVGAVLINRCEDAEFSDSLAQNAAALGILPAAEVSPMSEYAAGLAVSGLDPTGGAIYFYYGGDLAAASRHSRYITFASHDMYFTAN